MMFRRGSTPLCSFAETQMKIEWLGSQLMHLSLQVFRRTDGCRFLSGVWSSRGWHSQIFHVYVVGRWNLQYHLTNELPSARTSTNYFLPISRLGSDFWHTSPVWFCQIQRSCKQQAFLPFESYKLWTQVKWNLFNPKWDLHTNKICRSHFQVMGLHDSSLWT